MIKIDRLQDNVDACISSSIALYRLEGEMRVRNYMLDLKDALGVQRLTEQMVEQTLHYMAFRMLKARMSQLVTGELHFEVDLSVAAFNQVQCEQFNATMNFVPDQAHHRHHLIIETAVNSAIDQMLSMNKLLPMHLTRPDTPSLREYLVSRRIDFTQDKGELVLKLTIDLTKIILTKEQRDRCLPVLGRLIGERNRTK